MYVYVVGSSSSYFNSNNREFQLVSATEILLIARKTPLLLAIGFLLIGVFRVYSRSFIAKLAETKISTLYRKCPS